MSGGLEAQFGFEYQKKSFLFYLISNMSIGYKLSYELHDDVDSEKSEQDVHLTTSSTLIQCKSGDLQYSKFKRVFCNWLLSRKATNYVLLLEKPLSFNYTFDDLHKDIKQDIVSYMKGGKKAPRKDSCLFRVNEMYKIIENDDELGIFLSDLKYIFERFEVIEKSIDDLESEYKQKYIDEYCSALKIVQAKEQRFDFFVDLLRKELDDAISRKETYSIDHVHFVELNEEAVRSVGDNFYKINYMVFKNSDKNVYDTLLNSKEAIFLKKLYSNDKIIAYFLINELYYKDLRCFYVDVNKNSVVDELEEKAYVNYLFEKEKTDDCKEIFQNTIETSINNDILMNDEYRE